ncbi:MAG TPA: L-rhamnose isomerase [Gaiellaceae bacterium]|nr:L-rhamnose isomerase [Gaiellaceae bacterium]
MTAAHDRLAAILAERGDSIERVETALRTQRIETPSWAFGNSGTRFAVFPLPGVPRTTFEKLEDAAEVHRHTGTAPSVALHIPWDRVDDFGELRDFAAGLGLRLGAVNPNLFQEPAYKLGSVCNPDPQVRRAAIEHIRECIAIAGETGSDSISLWLADGTNYPGQDSLAGRRARLVESLQEVYSVLPESIELLVEYKLYEPAFYSTDLADWGSALTLCQELGPRARVLVDLGHHAHGVNIEQIVSMLQRSSRLGGFHFNDRKYGDDDLIVGSIDPFQLFLIFSELVATGAFETGVRLTIDQSHNIEPKIEAMIQSVVNLQEAYAKALLVDRTALAQAQATGEVLEGHRILLDAFGTDVRPICARIRSDLGASEDPVAAFRASGYSAAAADKRAEGSAAGWH